MHQLTLLMQKLQRLELSLERYEILIFSYLDYLIFLPNPQILNLILYLQGSNHGHMDFQDQV
jgi:hypothetical protein